MSDSDDDMFTLKKSLKKSAKGTKGRQSSKPPAKVTKQSINNNNNNNKQQSNSKRMSRLKKNSEESNESDYKPDEQAKQESSVSDLHPSSEDEKSQPRKKVATESGQQQQAKPRKKQTWTQRKNTVKKKTIINEDNLNPQIDEDEPNQGKQNCGEEFYKQAELVLPLYLQPDQLRDAEGRQPTDPDYDNRTLYIPIQAYQKLSPMFRQYWNAKRVNFDAVVFFRCGRWVTVLYNDAIMLAKHFNRPLSFWGRDRPCITVYDSQMPIYIRMLFERGHKILFIDQLEKGELANKLEGEVVNREITQIISRGTWQDIDEDSNYVSRSLMVISESRAPTNLKEQQYIYGIAIVDCTTNQFTIDQFSDDEHSNQLRTLLYKVKPVEVILHKVRDSTEKMIKHLCNPTIVYSKKSYKPIMDCLQQFKMEFMDQPINHKVKKQTQLVNDVEIPDNINMDVKVEVNINVGIYEDKQNIEEISQKVIEYTLSQDYPTLLRELEKQYLFEQQQSKQDDDESSYFSYYYAVQSMYILLQYLRSLIQSQTVYRRGEFAFLDSNYTSKSNLYLDSQALESLEIFEVNLHTKITDKGSLFGYLDHCATPFGKRLLMKWVQNPLFDAASIRSRQECVQDLMSKLEVADEFQTRVKSLPDIERAVVKCFNTIQSNRLKAVNLTGESFGMQRLRELSNLLKQLKLASESIRVFDNYTRNFRSTRLLRLVSLNTSKNGLFPDISTTLRQLEKCLLIVDGVPQPTKGISADYDQAYLQVSEIITELDDELTHWKKKLKSNDIQYSHGKFRYQIEVPDKIIDGDRKPAEFTITSKRKGFQRFQTESIERNIFKLRIAEEELSKQLVPFFNEYFHKFYTFRKEFYQLISCLAELDCLCSLAIVSSSMKYSCVPLILDPQPDDEQGESFHLKEAYHPCLMQQHHTQWIPNTVQFNQHVEALMLTGPNMSGKSTLLRLVGVNIIMAQIGCNVPAKQFTLVPFDRIFCRLGASDRLLEGKSTFFIELEETKTILDNCTPRSLVIIDELGRGTSTYDGVALASAVLRYLTTKIRPKTLFATHYHILLDEFAMFTNIKRCVMQHYQQGNKVVFEYRLVEGQAEKSFAANVARIAGIPAKVVAKASELEEKITKEESRINKNRILIQQFNQIIQDIFN